MPILAIRHVTTYRYRQPVAFGEHRMMLRPRDDGDQTVLESEIVITPEPIELAWSRDRFGNHVAIARFEERAAELRFESTIRVDHAPAGFEATDIEAFARRYPFVCTADDGLAPFLVPLSTDPRTPSLGRRLFARGRFGRHRRTSRRHDEGHQADVQARAAARAGNPGSAADPRTWQRELPRRRAADDCRLALARHRGAVRVGLFERRLGVHRRRSYHRRQYSRLGTGLCSRSGLGRLRSLDRQNRQSEILCGSRSCMSRAKLCRCRAPGSAPPPTISP